MVEMPTQILSEFEVGAWQIWHDDEIAPEGRIHFAGEHCFLVHRWMQGAVESGLCAAHHIHSIRHLWKRPTSPSLSLHLQLQQSTPPALVPFLHINGEREIVP